jgi:hypothetical protein
MIYTFSQLGRYGQFGNGLFQVAAVVGLARAHGWYYAFPSWNDNGKGDVWAHFPNACPHGHLVDNPRLHLQIDVEWDADPMVQMQSIYDKVTSTHPDGFIDLHGHFQSERWFIHAEPEICHIFDTGECANPLPQDAIAMHVRRGDYDGRYHNLLPAAYYDAAYRHIKHHAGKCPIHVFSDEPAKAQAELASVLPGAVFEPKGDFIEDWKRMKTARHYVIANSTYSWWAAWLGWKPGGIVVAPRKWFGDLGCRTWTHVIPERWIKL